MTRITNRPELSAEEKAMPLSQYYDLPLYGPGPRELQIIDANPIDRSLAIPVENLTDLLQPEGYGKAEYGWCIMDDGSAYEALYAVYPTCTPKMLGWWFNWVNVPAKNQPEGMGNLKYKIWCPPDHWDHSFANGKDWWGGVWSVESIDFGKGEEKVYERTAFLRHPLDPKEFGLTARREQELKETGCWIDLSTVTFHDPETREQRPGSYLWLTLLRNCPQGGLEKLTRLWIGYGVKDGEIVFDETTPAELLSNDYMRTFNIHMTVEHQHLAKLLPELYAKYSDRPADEV
jgi:phloretin hydrolase